MRDFLATLELERQAIFSTDASTAEQEQRWLKRKTEITTYLLNDNRTSSRENVDNTQPCQPLARTISNVWVSGCSGKSDMVNIQANHHRPPKGENELTSEPTRNRNSLER